MFCIKMLVKEPCTALFIGPIGCGKTKFVLDLLEGEFKGHFEYIFVLCYTLRWNKNYLERKCLWTDNCVFFDRTWRKVV